LTNLDEGTDANQEPQLDGVGRAVIGVDVVGQAIWKLAMAKVRVEGKRHSIV